MRDSEWRGGEECVCVCVSLSVMHMLSFTDCLSFLLNTVSLESDELQQLYQARDSIRLKMKQVLNPSTEVRPVHCHLDR